MTTPSPLFLLAPPRSFTSLVCAVVGQHPDHVGLPELNLFQAADMEEFWSGRNPDGTMKSPFWATMRHGLLRTLAQVYAGEQTIESVEMAERWIWARKHLSTGAVYHELCAALAPRRIVEKSPAYLRRPEYLERLLDTFPDARFLHLVRHPRGLAESVLKTPGGPAVALTLDSVDHSGDSPVIDPQILWHDSNLQIMRFLDRLDPGQWRRVRGEDLLGDLDRHLPELCAWLGVRADTEALAAMKRPEESPFSCLGPMNARLGNDVNFLKAPHLRDGPVPVPALDGPCSWRPDGAGLHPRVVAMARAFGYETPPEAAGEALAGLDRGFLGPALGAYAETGAPGDGLPLARITREPGLQRLAVSALKQLVESSDTVGGGDQNRLKHLAEHPEDLLRLLGGGEGGGTDTMTARRLTQDSPFRLLALAVGRKGGEDGRQREQAAPGELASRMAHGGGDLDSSSSVADLERYRERLSFSADVLETLLEETCNEMAQVDQHLEAARARDADTANAGS